MTTKSEKTDIRLPTYTFRKLFTPLAVGRLLLKIRMIMPPMIDRLAEDGMVGERVEDFYCARARGGPVPEVA